MQILITAICSLTAAIIGAFVVHWLTRSRENANWVRDSRIREWQELLETLSKSYVTQLMDPHAYDDESKKQYNVSKAVALADVDVMLSTRIFISEDVEQLDVRMRWAGSVNAFYQRRDKPPFMAAYQALHKDIVAKAKQTR